MTGRKPPKAEKPDGAAECPICGKPTVDKYRPFCSRRCANVDLNRWLSGHYAVPAEPAGRVPTDEDGQE